MPWYPIDPQGEINDMGSQLSIEVGCPIHYLAYQYGKPVYECKHGITFPLFTVTQATQKNNWIDIHKRHREELECQAKAKNRLQSAGVAVDPIHMPFPKSETRAS